MIFRKKLVKTHERPITESFNAIRELYGQIEDLKDKLEGLKNELYNLEKTVDYQKMDMDVILLTSKDKIEHRLIRKDSEFGEYERRADDLIERGFYIRKTFSKGEWELWLKHESKSDHNGRINKKVE